MIDRVDRACTDLEFSRQSREFSCICWKNFCVHFEALFCISTDPFKILAKG